MKKFFVFLLLLLVILAFAACGGKTETETPAVTEPADSAADAQTEAAEAPVSETAAAPDSAAAALIPGELFQLDAQAPVVRGLALVGNRVGTEAFNQKNPAAAGIRCIFELNEWVEVKPDTDAQDGLAVWVFSHKDDPQAYADAALSEETPGFAAYCELPFDPDAEADAARGEFYLNPDDCEAGYYDLVFSLNGKATAVLLTRFYNEQELASQSDEALSQLMTGLN